MRAHYFQHVPFEGLGSIEPWLRDAGYALSATRFFESAELPDPASIDLLVIMGGPMSVNDSTDHPWLEAEKRFVRDFVAAGKPVLGVCLGAQLIASALGARVFPNPVKEIGWWPVTSTVQQGEEGFRFPPSTEVFHWHGETFELPPGGVRLASSPACTNQAFQLGRSAIGLQFHLETTPDSARSIVAHCRDELVAGEYIQTEAALLAAAPERYRSVNRLMAGVLEYLVAPRP